MGDFFELHKHSEFSLFDGFGKIKAHVNRAKELGYTALGLSDHGNISGIVEHYNECRKNDINPICGIEAYFQPSFDPEKPSYHLCLFAKNLKGYQNLCKMISVSNRDNFYRTAKITYALLEQYSEGIICTSACIAGVIAQLITRNHSDKAEKTINRFKAIFGDDYYIEVMPYKIDDTGTQERVDRELMKLAKKTNTKVIVTTDSHFPLKEDFSTHKKMFEMQKKDMGDTYSERYMPSEKQVIKRCEKLYGKDINPHKFFDNLQELSAKCDLRLEFKGTIPKLEWDNEPKEQLKIFTKEGLIKRKKFTEGYKGNSKFEINVINTLGFEDYFLLVYDFMKAMKKKKIPVMPGRGSVCGSVVAYALGITNVDPLIMGTSFDRFLRIDKHKMPDLNKVA